jgi:hypothetical protein
VRNDEAVRAPVILVLAGVLIAPAAFARGHKLDAFTIQEKQQQKARHAEMQEIQQRIDHRHELERQREIDHPSATDDTDDDVDDDAPNHAQQR